MQSLDSHCELLCRTRYVVGSLAPGTHPVVPYGNPYSSYHHPLIRQQSGDMGQSVVLRKPWYGQFLGGSQILTVEVLIAADPASQGQTVWELV